MWLRTESSPIYFGLPIIIVNPLLLSLTILVHHFGVWSLTQKQTNRAISLPILSAGWATELAARRRLLCSQNKNTLLSAPTELRAKRAELAPVSH